MSLGSPHIVLVAGLYSPAVVLQLLAGRLRKKGYQVSVFSRHYPLTGAMDAARQLHQHLQSISSAKIHLVAHSYGGIVLLQLLKLLKQSGEADTATTRIGCCVFIASPLRGAQLATDLAHGQAGFFWKRILGKTLQQGLDGNHSQPELPVHAAFITGDKKSLLAKILQRDSGIGDGLVRFSETLAASQPATRQVSLPLTHAGLLYSRRCCGLIDEFIRHGCFPTDYDA